ncbi:MAG TPA: hypothetical protein VGM07_20675 [Stellaceae bacterium]|jgi:hypothetical protein
MMLRYAAIGLAALLTYFPDPSQDVVSGPPAMQIATAAAASRVAGVVNAIIITNKSAAAIRHYPLQFGRPFLRGAIPSGQCPVVAANGAALPTQADVKNRYPDGSAEFAIIAVVLPSVPARGAVQLSFAPGMCSNTPLSAAQMLDPSYNFDARMALSVPASPSKLLGRVVPAADQGIAFWNAITNGGFTVTVGGVPKVVSGVNLSHCVFSTSSNPNNCGTIVNAAVNAVIPGGATYQGPQAWQIGLAVPASHGALGYASAPPSGTDLSAIYGWGSGIATSLTQGTSAPTIATASARRMLQNGDYRLWTSGPVAQIVILADDTPSRKYDIGFGDGFHPFRPRFVATFWPQTHQVFVRAIGENGLTTELEDVSYALSLTGGAANPATEERLASLSQGAMQTWTKEFWLGGTPPPEVNIDNNLAYLESTRVIPNYDPSIRLSPATIAGDYAAWWANTSRDIGGSGAWTPGMPTTGARADIGPAPSWEVAWLYTGDWRLRQAALGNADLAAWWPANLRETDTTERLNVGDPVPVPPAVGSGFGKPFSITDRVDAGPGAGGEGIFLTYNSDAHNPPNTFKIVGPLNTNGAWGYDVAHAPSPFFVPYILTGDPFYLEEMENWAAYDAATNNGATAAGSWQGRGPTGAEGGLYDQLRGDGWGLKNRAEAAFAVPDGDPFKTYLTTLTQEDIARWEGALRIADPVLGGSAEYAWARKTGDPESRNTPDAAPPPLHNWEDGASPGYDGGGQWRARLTEQGYTNQWMQWYVQYSIGRAAELGFAAGPLVAYSGQYLINEINVSGYPKLVGAYLMPTSFEGSGPIRSWPALIADLSPSYLTGVGWAGTTNAGPIATFFNTQLYPQGYDAYVMAALSPLVDEAAPGAAQAEAWVKAHIHDPMVSNGALERDPSWAIVPRTDRNTLPPQPTALP